MSPHRRFVAAVLALGALAAFQLRDVLFFGRAFFERDLLYYYFPLVESIVRALAEGALPLRDATTGFGQPILGNPQSQALYPLTWLHLILAPDRVFAFETFVHFVLGGVGAGVLARRMSASPIASWFAGAFWMASGPFQSGLNVWHHFTGTVWMPWVLVAFDRLIETPSGSRMRWLGAAFGVQILAGSGDLGAMTLLLAALLLLCAAPEVRSLLPSISLRTLGALLIALGLGAGMWLPVSELVRSSLRGRLPREVRTEWSIHPVAATELALPLRIADLPLTAEARGLLSEGRPPFLRSNFLGALIAPLFLAGLFSSRAPRRHRIFLGAGSVGALLIALGKNAPIYDLAVAILPPLGMFRYPSKALFAFSLLACIAAGLGLDAIESRRSRLAALLSTGVALSSAIWILGKGPSAFGSMLLPGGADVGIETFNRGLALSVLSLAAFLAVLAGPRPSWVAVAAGLGLMATLLVNADINVTVPRAVIRYRPPFVPQLQDDSGLRVYAFDYLRSPDRAARVLGRPSFIPANGVPGLDAAAATVVLSRDLMLAPTAGAWGLEYAWDPDALGLFDRTLRDLTSRIQAARGPGLVRQLEIAAVRRVTSLHEAGFEGLPLELTIPLPIPEPLRVYRVPAPLPRAYAVSGVRVLANPAAANLVLDPSFDPHAEVVVEQGAPRSASAGFAADVKTVERRSDRVTLDATLNEPGEVVAVEGYLPGWRATVDGVDAPVRRANALFLAVEVPAGTHRVVFAYRPTGALVGVGLTVLTAAALLLSLVRLRS